MHNQSEQHFIANPVSSKVAYRVEGEGPVLVLLHGFPESGTLWRKITGSLANHFRLLIIDFPGSGESLLETQTSIIDMADCVKSILDHEQIENAVIAGHSMGGYVGFAFGFKYPERIAGLSLVHSTPVADDEERKKIRLKAIELLRKGGKTAFISQMVPNLFSPTFKKNRHALVQEQVELALEMPEESMINYYNAMIGRNDYSAWLKTVTFPVQWIIGIDDSAIPYKKVLQHTYSSSINFGNLYENCGHMAMLETPEKLIADLAEFTSYCYGIKLI